ncbi:MAG: NAD(P)-binding domain-containing protein [Patescibacteria group bacterium]
MEKRRKWGKGRKGDKAGKPLIGFIGQGFIGKNYADDFEKRGYKVVRYARGKEYAKNRERLQECDIVFIAVPTPTTPRGFDFSIVREVLQLVGKGKIAVIKSTILPGTTDKLQAEFPDIFVFHSPEFLREASAAYDAAHPDRNIVGIPRDAPEHRARAEQVMSVLARAPFERIMHIRDAELVKYGGNCFLYFKVVFANLLYDVSTRFGLDWNAVKEAVAADPRIGPSHLEPVHRSGHGGKPGRGAGGHCLIKDFAAFSLLYEQARKDPFGKKVLTALRDKNNQLLRESGKDLDLLEEVYGRPPRRTNR